MAQKTGSSGSQKNKVRVGNISGVSGSLNIAGGNIETHQTNGLSAAEIKQLFDGIYATVQTRSNTPPTVQDDLNAEVKEVQSMITQAVQKNDKVDESSLSRHFRNIARLAPDMLDVIVATLANPLAGIGVAVKKIAEKAREETKV